MPAIDAVLHHRSPEPLRVLRRASAERFVVRETVQLQVASQLRVRGGVRAVLYFAVPVGSAVANRRWRVLWFGAWFNFRRRA